MKVAAAFAEPEACCDKGGLPPPPCAHLAAFLAAPEALNKINLVKGFVGTLSSSNRFAKRRRVDEKPAFPVPKCAQCGALSNRLHVVLDERPTVLCFEHLQAYFKNSKSSFGAAVDLTSGEIFCSKCCDYVYSEDAIALPRQTLSSGLEPSHEVFPRDHMLGIRGLNNMGATCFINAVLQVLVHLPSVRSFFARDGHSIATCTNAKEGKVCMMCELERVYIAMFSHAKEPFSPANLMYVLWKTKDDLAGYDQRDAQEFLVAILDELHSSTSPSSSGSAVSQSCGCLAHKTFGGEMESWIKCTKCGSESTTWTPILEINIEVPKLLKKRLDESTEIEPMTLLNSLANYCNKERLDDYKCAQCKCENLADRIFSIYTLPEVLTIHLKRFEQTQHGRKKIVTHISFSDKLDLRPYISATIHPNSKREGAEASNGETEYELIGIVNHHGSLDRGHYKCCVLDRATSQWLLCDDHHITKVSRDFVLRCDAYMLFYAKKSSMVSFF